MPSNFLPSLEEFASDITKAFKLKIDFNPEDQLKKPVSELFESAGQLLKLTVGIATEVQAEDIGPSRCWHCSQKVVDRTYRTQSPR